MKQYIEEAGAVVLRKHDSTTEVLLIFSKKQPTIRIFPKGHIEPGETVRMAAERELLEEAGIEGDPLGEAGAVIYEFNQKWYRVAYYFFRYRARRSDGEPGRSPGWFTPEEALKVLTLEQLRQLITATSLERFNF